MSIRRFPTSVIALALCATAVWQVGCSGALPPPAGGPGMTATGAPGTPDEARPRYRPSGPRAPTFLGQAPSSRGWVLADGLLYLEAQHLEAFRQGLVWDGRGYRPWAQALPPGAGPLEAFRLRTGRFLLHTNAPWQEARGIALEAERHVDRLIQRFGEAADLRLPEGPLPIVVSRTRAGFESLLPAGVPRGRYAAWYDAQQARVLVSLEPVAGAEIPWQADLRHELTHQIFDLSRHPALQGRGYPAPWFWLWEGVALHAESLGGGVGQEAFARRWQRFQVRRGQGQALPVAQLFQTPTQAFSGQHYDQTAVLMQWLLSGRVPGTAARIDRLLAHLQRGAGPAGTPAQQLGMRPQDLEVAFRRYAAGR